MEKKDNDFPFFPNSGRRRGGSEREREIDLMFIQNHHDYEILIAEKAYFRT